MPISVSTFVAATGPGWKSVGGQLLASGVLLLSGYQDMGFRNRGGAPFWFFVALAFSVQLSVRRCGVGFGLAPRSVPWFFASKLGWSDTGGIGGSRRSLATNPRVVLDPAEVRRGVPKVCQMTLDCSAWS